MASYVTFMGQQADIFSNFVKKGKSFSCSLFISSWVSTIERNIQVNYTPLTQGYKSISHYVQTSIRSACNIIYEWASEQKI